MVYSICQPITGLESGNEVVLHVRAIPEARWVDNHQHVRPLYYMDNTMRDEQKHRESSRKWYIANREKRLEAMKKWHMLNYDKEKQSIYAKEYYIKHRIQILERNKKHYQMNRNRINKRIKKYQSTFPERMRAGRLARYWIPLASYCELCRKPATDHHHSNYSKPLFIISLCRDCHMKIHSQEMRKK